MADFQAEQGNPLPPRKAAEYLQMLKALLPRGLAWAKSPGTVLEKTLAASAEELGRLDASIQLLPMETNPVSTVNALEDWEKALALPDACLPAGPSFDERKSAVLVKLQDEGRQDMAWWYELAATLGYEITIEEHWPFCCGWHECGNPAEGWTPESGMTPERWEQDVAYPIGRCGPEEIHYWLNVVVHGDRLLLFRCGTSETPERLMDWRGAQNMECLISRDIEAHVLLTFDFHEF